MSIIEDALDQVIKGTVKEAFIPCTDKANQESIRVMSFNRKRKLPTMLKDSITISKYSSPNGKLFVKVYKKSTSTFMVLNSDGEMVPYKTPFDPESNPALQRQLKLMKEDGASKEELDKVIEEAEREWLG